MTSSVNLKMAPPVLPIFRRRVVNYFRGLIAAFEAPYPGQYHGVVPAFVHDIDSAEVVDDERASVASSILNGIIGNGILWAVQTKRRSLERRQTRLRCEEKLHKIKNNLLMCVRCGHVHEAHTICGYCYEKIRDETKAMQEAIANEWNAAAVDKEVAVFYKGDSKDDDRSGEFCQGKRIVEMKKPRPDWFHRNLKVKTRSPPPDGGETPSSTSVVAHIK